MAKILLAHPLFLAKSPEESELSSPYFPLGLLYLAGYVRDQGHDVAIFDGTFRADESEFTTVLEDEAPDIVGISALQPTRETALALAELAAKYNIAASQQVAVMMGGPDPTESPERYLGPAVDLVVHHEGEQTLAHLADLVDQGALSLEQLTVEPGIAYRRDGQMVVNQPRPPLENLDELPLPARDLIDMDRYLNTWEQDQGYSSVTIATSRGCPFGCQWCQDAVHGAGFRQRSPESVAAEVKALSERYEIERLRFIDDVDGIDREWFERWALASQAVGADTPFEPLSESARPDLPLLDVRDSL